LKKLSPDLEVIPLPMNRVLFESGERVDWAYFLNSGMASLIAVNSNGNSIEVAAVGNEGMVPVCVLTGPQYISYRCVMQISGSGLKISMKSLRDQFRGILGEQLLGFMQMLHNQSCQLVLCNRFHTIEQRLCRWLLITADRAGDNHFPITHEFVSYMLGANRSNVTVALGALKAAGFISYRKGMLSILDRARIESIACECYRSYRREIESYVKFSSRRGSGLHA
jgi:CRP-like cAMP-binding protein